MDKSHLNIAIVPGDENGIGPELLIQAISQYKSTSNLDFFWCGDFLSLGLAAERAHCLITPIGSMSAQLGKNKQTLHYIKDSISGSKLERQAGFLHEAVKLSKEGKVDAIVTGPINKAALAYLKGNFVGQTEYFAKHLAKQDEKPFMAFMGGPFLLSLLTTHLPLASVPKALSHARLVEHLLAVAHHCSRILRKHPTEIRIAILGLNPHAGEGGLLGTEEAEIIEPAILEVKALGLSVTGPLPADGFFAYFHLMKKIDVPDVLVAIYHDQGLIPYKLLAAGSAVNVTLGLTIPRTSPAHGTAEDLAGKMVACPQSTEQALQLAIDLAKR